jgi:hypothetical protein
LTRWQLAEWDRNASGMNNNEFGRNSNNDFNSGSGGDFAAGSDNYQSKTGEFDSGAAAGAGYSSYDRDNEANFGGEQTRDFNKPSIGDKLAGMYWSFVATPMFSFSFPSFTGSAQKMAGKLMNDEGMVERGQERKAGVKITMQSVY